MLRRAVLMAGLMALWLAAPDDRTVIALGPTVVAGRNCVPVPGGARCTQPPGTTGWERSRAARALTV